jgi:predicted TIM-barrel fold metal-dependent hydrolase
LSLVYEGVLDACPDLTIVHPHLGGALPAVVDRVVECEVDVDTRFELRTYLRRNFFVDSVQKTPGAARLAVETYGLERVVFATDYPWVDRRGSREATCGALPPAEFDAVIENRVPGMHSLDPMAGSSGSD